MFDWSPIAMELFWDTLFEVTPLSDGTELKMTMEARAYQLVAKLLIPLMRGKVQKAVERDMDLVKAYCEAQAR